MNSSRSTCRYCKWRGINDSRCYFGYEQGEVVKYDDSCSHFMHAADDEPIGYVRGVILCKDCKFNDLPETCGNSYCTKGMSITNPYGYCSEGERRAKE